MTNILILGAGGHGEVVAEILSLRGQAGNKSEPLLSFLDDDPALLGAHKMGHPVLGALSDVAQIDHDFTIVAIGNNRVRADVLGRLLKDRRLLTNAIHLSAEISPSTQLGAGVVICARSVVGTAVRIGDGVILDLASTVSHHVSVGDYAHLCPGVTVAGGTRIGAGTMVGTGATVLPGISIGDWVVVGAGAVVTRDVQTASPLLGCPPGRSARYGSEPGREIPMAQPQTWPGRRSTP